MNKLNRIRKKTIFTALAFLAVFTGILLAAEWYLFRLDIREDGRFKAESIRKTIQSYQSEAEKMTEWFYERLNENVRLSVLIQKNQLQDGTYTGKMLFDDAMIVRVHNGKTELTPEGSAIFPELQPEDVITEYSPKRIAKADGQEVLITSGMISEGLYYLDWTDIEEYQEFFNSQIDAPQLLNFMADAYGGEIFLISDDNLKWEVILGTDETDGFNNIGERGLQQKFLGNRYFSFNKEPEQYICYTSPLEDEEHTVVYCDIITDEVYTGIHRAFTKILFAGCFLSAMLVFCFSVISGIKNGTISESKAAGYTPEKMRQKIILFSLLSGLVLMFITIFTTFVQESHHENSKGISILDSLELQLAESDHRSDAAKQTEIDWYQYYGEKIAAKIKDDPRILEKDMLSGIAQLINTDLIMAFDENGNEAGCSSDYIGFSLVNDGENQDIHEYQRLLKGIPAVIRGPEPDFITGLEHYVIGVPYQLDGHSGYGAFLMFVSPSALTARNEDAAIRRIYSNLVTDEELIMEIDPESFEIRSTSAPRLSRSKFLDLDANSQDIQENKLDIFVQDSVLYYGISRMIRERIWYYAEKISGIVISSLIYSAVTSLIFVAFCLLTGRYAMSGYTRERFEEYLSVNRKEESIPEVGITANDRNKEMTSYRAELLRQWQKLSPEGKTSVFLQVSCGLIVLVLLAAGFLSKYAALSFYITGSWQRGLNPLAITAIILIVCLGRLFLILMNMIFAMVTLEMSPKEKTVAQLIRSILRFVVIIGLLYNCLAYLGINTGTLLASVGILSLALSLGAKDLVSDTLAGLGIVFEGAFQTGEIVEIGGFKGFVEEIGIRTTRIRSIGTDNIKIINNSDIHNVINYSRELSLFKVTIDLPVLLPIDIVTEYLERELPAIGKEIPTIVNGPSFFGITQLDRNQMTILIAGKCMEKDQLLISLAMNMKIKERIDQLIDYKSK